MIINVENCYQSVLVQSHFLLKEERGKPGGARGVLCCWSQCHRRGSAAACQAAGQTGCTARASRCSHPSPRQAPGPVRVRDPTGVLAPGPRAPQPPPPSPGSVLAHSFPDGPQGWCLVSSLLWAGPVCDSLGPCAEGPAWLALASGASRAWHGGRNCRSGAGSSEPIVTFPSGLGGGVLAEECRRRSIGGGACRRSVGGGVSAVRAAPDRPGPCRRPSPGRPRSGSTPGRRRSACSGSGCSRARTPGTRAPPGR